MESRAGQDLTGGLRRAKGWRDTLQTLCAHPPAKALCHAQCQPTETAAGNYDGETTSWNDVGLQGSTAPSCNFAASSSSDSFLWSQFWLSEANGFRHSGQAACPYYEVVWVMRVKWVRRLRVEKDDLRFTFLTLNVEQW